MHTDDPNFLLNYLINDLLLPQGVAMSHAGGVVSPEGKAILLPGAGGVGKTTLALRLVERHGFRFLGDDIVLLDEQGHCLAFPRALVLKPGFGDILPGLAEQLGIEDPGLAAAEPTLPGASAISSGNIPLRGAIRAGLERIGVRALVSRWVHGTRRLAVVPSEDIFSPDQVVECAPLGSVVFLERSDGRRPQVTPISRDALIGRMSSILLYEWSDYMRDVFTWSSLGLTDFPAHVSRLCNVFRKGLPEHGTLLRIPQTSSVEDLESAALRAIEGGSS